MADALEDWMTVPEAAKSKGVAESSVRLAILTGRLTGQKMGRNYVVRRQEVEQWVPTNRGPRRRQPKEAA